ncbi:MAG: DUF5915 domain-containing protein, partial [Candidatus Uhrbacteria bacterium]
ALAMLSIQLDLPDAILELVAEELNVKRVVVDKSLEHEVRLDTTLTPELKREGMIRELTRKVNGLRKDMGLTPSDRIRVVYAADGALAQAISEHLPALTQSTMASEWESGTPDTPQDVLIAGESIKLSITKT